MEYILNLIYPSKDKDIKEENKLNTIQERNIRQQNKKAQYNLHDPEFEVEIGNKYSSKK